MLGELGVVLDDFEGHVLVMFMIVGTKNLPVRALANESQQLVAVRDVVMFDIEVVLGA